MAVRRSPDAAEDAPAAAVAEVAAADDVTDGVAVVVTPEAVVGGGMRGGSSSEDAGSVVPDEVGWSPIVTRWIRIVELGTLELGDDERVEVS